MTEPTLADDEAALAGYAAGLVTAVQAVAVEWLRRLVEQRAPGLTAGDEVTARLAGEADGLVERLEALLTKDIADQQMAPLEVLRRAIHCPTEVLAEAGVEPSPRDEFSKRNFPNDVYALTPASFADVDPSLHEPGLMWGAAKAHVHLRRRRQ